MQPVFIRELSGDAVKNDLDATLQQHPRFFWLTDTLSRSEQHHALLVSQADERWHTSFAEGFTRHLASSPVPAFLKQTDCYFINAPATLWDDSFKTLAPRSQRHILVILSFADKEIPPAPDLIRIIHLRLNDPRWRFVFLAPPEIIPQLGLPHITYAETTFPVPTSADTQRLLQHESARIEQFHQVILPNELLVTATSLAERWLRGDSLVEKTLQLLDSAAARTALSSQSPKPVVSVSQLNHIVSDWARIPSTCLQNNCFAAGILTDALRQFVFGQDDAIHRVARLLQTACLRLLDQPGPFCHFLLIGPKFSGKSTLAITLANTLSGPGNGLIHIQPTDAFYDSLQRVRDMPAAVILIEDIEAQPRMRFALLHAILTKGHLTLPDGSDLNLTQAVIVFTSATQPTSSQPSVPLTPSLKSEANATDLMNLVLGPPKNTDKKTPAPAAQLTLELPDADITLLPDSLPSALKNCMHPVIFAPLSANTADKIVRKHLAMLVRHLEIRSNVTLDIMPEVNRFLTQTLLQAPTQRSVDQMLQQLLVPKIAHCFYAAENRHSHTQRLQVRLNANGDAMVCEFVAVQEGASLS